MQLPGAIVNAKLSYYLFFLGFLLEETGKTEKQTGTLLVCVAFHLPQELCHLSVLLTGCPGLSSLLCKKPQTRMEPSA